MKRQVIAFFVIALSSELVTTWLQGLRGNVSHVKGLYYPNFKEMMFERLFFWTIVFLTLTGLWTLLAKRLSKS